jgi:hypothetical protein
MAKKEAQQEATTEATESAKERKPIRRVTEEEARVYDDAATANENKPDRESWHLFQITDPKGRQRFTWAAYYSAALWRIVIDTDKSYAITAVEDLPSKAEVSGYLAALSPKEREEVLKQFGKK